MLCHRCRRLTAAVIRQGSTTLSRHAKLVHTTSLAHSRLGSGSKLQPLNGFLASRFLTPRYYSASSSASNPENASSTAKPTLEKPDYLDASESAIWDKLVAEFAPTELSVQDISGGCGSMYGIEIASEKFRGANMLKQQRMVNAVLGDQMKGWHGVQLRTKVP
ncbi:bola-like protein [Hypoxylon sp. FL0543]|nr:bola-like protein [Hypoxylon sp. FL0543]